MAEKKRRKSGFNRLEITLITLVGLVAASVLGFSIILIWVVSVI